MRSLQYATRGEKTRSLLGELVDIAEDLDSGCEDLRRLAHEKLEDLRRSGYLNTAKQLSEERDNA